MTRVLLSFVLLLVMETCVAQELGRLFFTPEQRAALDARRSARVPDRPAAAAVASPTTKLDGYVKRSGGKSTVWVNGEALSEGSGDAPRIGSGADGRVSVPIGDGRRAGIRPGEAIDRGTGEVRDVIGGGEIRVHRSP